jgi:molybdopterin-binding protein
MPQFRISDASRLLAVSDDTVRRWIAGGRLTATGDASGRTVIEGAELARFIEDLAATGAGDTDERGLGHTSARNRFTGLVTRIVTDTVMAQVDIQAGPHRVVSLLSRESVDELRLEVGMLATATVKATNVIVEVSR